MILNAKHRPSPAQRFTVLARNAEHIEEPEQKLMLAILYQTCVDFETKDEYELASLRRFVKTKWFGMICDFVGLTPTFAREIITKEFNDAGRI
jgi:hypothetical protein